MTTAATAVVDGYTARAQFARAETDSLSTLFRPCLLRGLLSVSGHVAEFPCGAGHFLADYAAAEVETTLIDGNEAMLAVAIEHAAAAGLPADRTHAQVRYLHKLGDLVGVDLMVVPNVALNQLACQTQPVEVLAAIYRALSPEAEVLAQVACTHPGGGVATTGCYDPSRQHGVWFTDRYFDPDQAAGAVQRRRRQHRGGNGTHVHGIDRGLHCGRILPCSVPASSQRSIRSPRVCRQG